MRACWLLPLIPLLVAAGRAAGAQETPPPGTPAALAPLYRVVEGEFSLKDADLAAAIKALKETTGLVATMEGKAPERKATLSVKGIPARDLLDALAALYGLQWDTRTTMIVFSPFHRSQPGAAGAKPQGGAPAPAMAQVEQVIQWLRDSGIGGERPPMLPPGRATEMIRQLADIFTPEQRQQMAQAGPNAIQFGVRVRDLPPPLQEQILRWKAEDQTRSAIYSLWNAARPMDRYLDATIYIRTTPDGGASLTIGSQGPGGNWSEGHGLPRE